MARRPPPALLSKAYGTAEDTPSTMSHEALRAGWRRVIGKPMPRHLPPALLQRVLAYRQQAQQHGDLGR